jgi:hypothetical protein
MEHFQAIRIIVLLTSNQRFAPCDNVTLAPSSASANRDNADSPAFVSSAIPHLLARSRLALPTDTIYITLLRDGFTKWEQYSASSKAIFVQETSTGGTGGGG